MRLATIEPVLQDAWSDQLGNRELRLLDEGGPIIAVAVGSDEVGWTYEMYDREVLPDDTQEFVATLCLIIGRLTEEKQ